VQIADVVGEVLQRANGRVMQLDPLIEDTLAALVATTLLGAVIAGAYWLLTGISPWPFVILGEAGGLGFGVAMLALCSPRRRRP
jgi:uncharacterized membrane protein YdjX (TVP38/TMEM64 family)